MAPAVQQVAQIFEDPQPRANRHHARTPSVAAVLRRRRKETSPRKSDTRAHEGAASLNPLGERHINSPPQAKRVPTKSDDSQSPTRKISGSNSLKEMLTGREKNHGYETTTGSEVSTGEKAKKIKTSSNLASLLKKKSKKDLQDNSKRQENVSPTKQTEVNRTPIWAQFATQPLESVDGQLHSPNSKSRTLEEEISLYTPKDYSEFRPAEQRNFYGCANTETGYKPPQRPFLQHKSSHGSIFTENIDDEIKPPAKDFENKAQNYDCPSTSHIPTRPNLGSKGSHSSQIEEKPKRTSRVLDVISTFNARSRRDVHSTPGLNSKRDEALSPQQLESEFEKVLDSLNVPQNMRDNMRSLKPDVKAGLMKFGRSDSGSSTSSFPQNSCDLRSSARSPQKKDNKRPESSESEDKEGKRSRSRSRPRSRILTLSKRDVASPTKQEKTEPSTRSRSKSRPKSIDLTGARSISSRSMASTTSVNSLAAPDSATAPGDFIHYLQEVQKPALVEVGKLHKLRILLRNEAVTWTDQFVTKGGMDQLVQLLYRITEIEWREEHEDNLLHETLLCLKALCTTTMALQHLERIGGNFFPKLLAMLFDPERKGPSEFSTRAVIISLVFAHLSAAVQHGPNQLEERARSILKFLSDPAPDADKQPLDFVSQMHVSRPYRVWCKEVSNVTKEVFWIFLHHMNVVPIPETTTTEDVSYFQAHFPAARPPHPAAPYVGGVEWEATQYLANHLDLLNGLLASFSDVSSRNSLREELKQSGWEKVMGGSLRTCKEKFYGGVHEGLKVWVAAAKADGWYVEDVRAGPPRETLSPQKSPNKKKKAEEAPKVSLDLGGGLVPKSEDWV